MSRSSSEKSFLGPFDAKSEGTLFKQLLTPPPAAGCVCSAGSLISTKICVRRSFILVISANGTQIFHSLKFGLGTTIGNATRDTKSYLGNFHLKSKKRGNGMELCHTE